jgi:nitric oxide synthase oxygenase domain/subunit
MLVTKIAVPTQLSRTAEYDKECREALRPAFEELIAAAEAAGWDRHRAAFEIMYLASSAGRS